MAGWGLGLRVAGLAAGLLSVPAGAQVGPVVGPATTVTDELHAMSDAAAVVFVGRVVAVKRVDAAGAASGVVEVTFQVEQGVRGCVAGEGYVLREWAGLWSGGEQRYRVGQWLMMLLRAPGAAGLSSPVGGLDGAIPVSGAGNAKTVLVHGEAAPATLQVTEDGLQQPGEQVDLRWIAARVERAVTVPLPGVKGRVAGEQSADYVPGVPKVPVEALVNMIGIWERERDSGR